MREFFLSARVVDVVLAVLALETLALLAWHRASGRGLSPRALLPNLAAGAFLLLALRAVLGGQSWPWVAAALSAAGLAHLFDLRGRWPGAQTPASGDAGPKFGVVAPSAVPGKTL